jgi:hypothetical protein
MSGAVFAVNSADRTVGNNHDYQGSYSIKKAKEVEVKKLATGTTANVGYLNIFAKSNGLPYFKDENGMETPLVAGAAEVARVGAYNAGSHGSSGTRVILFDNAETAVGTGLTLTNDATNGTYVQVAASVTDDMVCLAEMSYVGNTSGTSVFGFQKTTTLSDEYTTSIDSGTASKVFGINEGAASAKFGSTSAAIPCTGGDIIRPMDSSSGVVNVNSDRSKFSVTLLRRGTGSAGAVLNEWQDISGVTFSGLGTVSGTVVKGRRVGDSLELQGYTVAGTVSGSTFSIDLPAAYPIDTAKVGSSTLLAGTGLTVSGSAGFYANAGWAAALFSDGSDTNSIFAAYRGTGTVFEKMTGTTFSQNGAGVSFHVIVPISGWAGGFGAGESAFRVGFGGATDGTNCTGSPCTIHIEKGSPNDWISSVTRSGTGNYTVNFQSGVFPNKPVCVMSGGSGANSSQVDCGYEGGTGAPGTGSIDIECRKGDVVNDAFVQMVCYQ